MLSVPLFSYASATSTVSLASEVHTLSEKYQIKIPEETILDVIKCESSYDQSQIHSNKNKKGVVWSLDVGLFQLNDYYQQKAAANLGFDIYNSDQNLEYGLLLMQKNDLSPWSASESCWNKDLAIK